MSQFASTAAQEESGNDESSIQSCNHINETNSKSMEASPSYMPTTAGAISTESCGSSSSVTESTTSSTAISNRPRTNAKLAHSMKLKKRRDEKAKNALQEKKLALSSSSSTPVTPLPSIACPIEGLSSAELAQPLIQKILGVIYGQALGDAFGLSTEFLSSTKVAEMYGASYEPSTGVGAIPFPKFIQTRHSIRWDDGDWTDDTDQMILILETILKSYSGEHRFASAPKTLDAKLFASKLKAWVQDGFPALGDECGMGLGELTYQVVSHHKFLQSPHIAAKDVWVRGKKQAAANGGVMRTSITGIFEYYTDEAVIQHTQSMCQVTHADPRCIASCILVATLISSILRGAQIETSEQTEELISRCLVLTLDNCDLGEHQTVFKQYVDMQQLSEMKLDESTTIGFTLKCLSAGLFGLRSEEPFVPTLMRLVREGGDADTNGAVCGALIGARVGYDGLPSDWLNSLPNKKWLDAKVVELIRLILDRSKGHIETEPPSEMQSAATTKAEAQASTSSIPACKNSNTP